MTEHSAIAHGISRAAHFEALVDSSEDAILSKDENAVITSWNPAAERLYGWTAEEAIGRRVSMIVPDDHADEDIVILGRILAGERLEHFETERVAKDGRRVFVSLTVSPILEDGERIVGASVVARDITDRVRARERAERLQEVTSALGREAELERAMEILLEAGTGVLGADAAAVGLLDASGETVELVDSAGHSDDGMSEWQEFPVDSEVPMCRAIADLEPIWTSSAENLVERFPALGGSEIRFAALAVLPLAVEGRALGAVSFSFLEPRQFGAEERAFIGAIVQQAAYNIERARLFDAERRDRRRLSFIARASEVLSEKLDTNETLDRLADLSVRHFADWCAVDLLTERGQMENVVTAHVDRSKVELAQETRRLYPPRPDAPGGAASVVRSGEPVLIERVTEEMIRSGVRGEDHYDRLQRIGIASAIIVPLSARGRTLGAMTFLSSDPENRFDADDLELAGDLGRRTALAIDTSELYRREHETALTLQRALLPGTLPQLPGVELAARYLPAEAGLEVGGDWFDAIRSSEGRVELVIGDVSGRGVRAAAVMGRLAIALRAYALDGRPVESVIGGINQLLSQLDSPEIATVFLLSLEPATGHVRYARAGHLPALVRTAAGEVTELTGEGGPPIGWLGDLSFSANTAVLPAGCTVLLFTDGLIERRDSNLDEGLERLKRAFAEAPEDPEGVVQSIPAALGAERVADDIALLAAKLGD